MAVDTTPPRLKLIATIAVITVVTLICLDFVFKSYYGMMTDEAQREKSAPLRDREDQQKAEQAALTNAAMPIDQAMSQLAKGTRPESISPQQSEDLGAMTGWGKLPKPAPTPLPKAQLDTSDGGVDLSSDGGVDLAAGDAGATHDGGAHAGMGDGGAHAHDAGPKPAPAPHH